MIKHARINAEILPLTGIRALAAIWVVAFHLKSEITDAYPKIQFLIDPIVSHGYLGVDLFFILSGFIIYYNYNQRFDSLNFRQYKNFLVMRLARIWPVHITILIAYLILLGIQKHLGSYPENPELYTGTSFLKNVFLVHGWNIPIHVTWNAPAWSISCEWFAYLLFPLTLIAAKNRRSQQISTDLNRSQHSRSSNSPIRNIWNCSNSYC